MALNRRQFIQRCTLLYGSILLFPACHVSGSKTSYYSFSEEVGECIGAISEQFIPADDFPGAKDAGVVNFIDKLLFQRFPDLKEKYLKGIEAVEASARDSFGKSFASLAWDQQMLFLQKMERGELVIDRWKDISQSEFFEMILRHTMQGFYGSPRHGGNKNYVSYRMMKVDFPLLIGQNRYGK